jgi:hypothetical protein
MFDEHALNTKAKGNLDLLCDVETFLGLSYIIPLLGCMQSLSKFVQVWDVFICDFVVTIKACERDLYKLYVDPITNHGHADGIFQIFLAIVHHSYDPIHMVWIFLNLILVWSI